MKITLRQIEETINVSARNSWGILLAQHSDTIKTYYLEMCTESGVLREDVTNIISDLYIYVSGCNFKIGDQAFKNIEYTEERGYYGINNRRS